MKILVKTLQSQECSLEVSPEITVLALKEIVETQMNIPPSEQVLLLLGRPIQDDKFLKDCGLKDGSKLNLVRRRGTGPLSAAPTQSTSRVDAGSLKEELLKFLLKHDVSQTNAQKIVEEFMKEFQKSMNALSLDDIERIAKSRLQEEKARMS